MASELAIRSEGGGQITTRMLHVIKTGDLRGLTEPEQLVYYVHECERMGLDPASRPLAWITLNGKLVLYALRVAGDMLAAKHRVTVALVSGPEVKDFGGTKLLFAQARATMPDGRSVEDVATVPANDLVNAVMKVTSKAIRRATLRLCGWGGLDESELETIPATSVSFAEPASAPRSHGPLDSDVHCPDAVLDSIACAVDDAGSITLDTAGAIYVDHEGELGQEDRTAAFAALKRACGASAAKLNGAIALGRRVGERRAGLAWRDRCRALARRDRCHRRGDAGADRRRALGLLLVTSDRARIDGRTTARRWHADRGGIYAREKSDAVAL
jgi:hypothetical protein